MSCGNYGGKRSNTTSYVKSFTSGNINDIWVYSENGEEITPSLSTVNVHVPVNLIVDGAILNPSDKRLKKNIVNMPQEYNENLMKLMPKCFGLNREGSDSKHFGFIAQELEELFPNLVINNNTSINNSSCATSGEDPYKSVNYLEIIPLLLFKIQDLQSQIDKLALSVDEKTTIKMDKNLIDKLRSMSTEKSISTKIDKND